MPKIIKNHKEAALAISLGLILTIATVIGMSGLIVLPSPVSAATSTTQTVSVSATVRAWLSFTAAPGSVELLPDIVDMTGGEHIASSSNVTLTIGTNATNGWSVVITGANNGLANGATVIASVNDAATTTITAGTAGYGANATNTTSTVSVGAGYGGWGTAAVGSIRTGGQTLITSTTKSATESKAYMKVYAAAPGSQGAGTYADTITLTITTSP